MSFKGNWDGRKAYKLHVTGNRLCDEKKLREAQAQFDEALRLYAQAMQGGCTDARVIMAYGVLLLKQRKFEEAREVMLKTEKLALSGDQKRQLRMNYAVCQWKLGHLDQGIEQLRRVGQDGMNSMIYGSLGYMLIEKALETGDFEEAIAFNKEAYDYDEDDPVMLDNMGQLALAMGEREKARGYFERAIEEKPTQSDTLYYLGKMMHEDGKRDKAREYLTRAVESNYSALCTTTRDMAHALLKEVG